MIPDVYGIAAVDISGNIEYKGKPIGHAFDVVSLNLDKAVLAKYCRGLNASDDVVVIGENTYKSSHKLFPEGITIVRSSSKGIEVFSKGSDKILEKIAFNQDDDSLAILQQIAFFHALKKPTESKIHVFGGVSVYKSFERVYTKFYLCRFHGTPSDAKGKLEFTKNFSSCYQYPMIMTSLYSVHQCSRLKQ